MTFQSSFNPHSPQAAQRREAMLARIAQLRALEERAAQASAKSAPVFHKRGQLLPRERVALLLDPAGYGVMDFRLYTAQHGKLPEFMTVYRDMALPLQPGDRLNLRALEQGGDRFDLGRRSAKILPEPRGIVAFDSGQRLAPGNAAQLGGPGGVLRTALELAARGDLRAGALDPGAQVGHLGKRAVEEGTGRIGHGTHGGALPYLMPRIVSNSSAATWITRLLASNACCRRTRLAASESRSMPVSLRSSASALAETTASPSVRVSSAETRLERPSSSLSAPDDGPVGKMLAAPDLAEWGVLQVGRAFSLAFSLALPFVIAALLYNLALGIVNRAMPALAVSFIGAPALTLGGLILFALAAPLLLEPGKVPVQGAGRWRRKARGARSAGSPRCRPRARRAA